MNINHLFSFNGPIDSIVVAISDSLWTYLLIGLLLGCGLYFSWRTGFVQFRYFREMVRLLTDTSVAKKNEKHISSFQAFAVSVATRVGTGNLAGVATAIAIGGPGAVFWMWIVAIIGSATAFVESTLAQLYKRHHRDSFIGGPAYYIRYGLHCKWMAVLFALLITITFGLSYNSIQSNTICNAMYQAFGWNKTIVGLSLSGVSLLIVFGGIQRIAKISALLVPIMAIAYFLLALYVVVTNITLIPEILKIIIGNAFGFEQVAGGGVGAAILHGIKRGLFSNEAGEGSAPNVAATAAISHPVKQGLVQALGVFTDTIIVCSCTAFMILISGKYIDSNLSGIELTQVALKSEIGNSGPVFIAIAIFLFAYSSIIGNYYYGEANIRFMTNKRWVLTVFRICSGGIMVMFGAVASLNLVWNIGDLCMALLTCCNLVAIIALGKYAFRLLSDYQKQKKEGIKEPTFLGSEFSDISDDIECWK